MKKMMKITAASLCLALAITTFSACSSTENNKPSEEPSKPTEEVTTTEEPTEAPTQEPTVTVEPTTEPPTGEVIVPLFASYHTLDEITQVSVADLYQNYNFIDYFAPLTTDEATDSGIPLFQFRNGTAFQMINPADTESAPVNVEIYLYFDSATGNTFNLYYVIDGTAKSDPFLPIIYNQSKGCFVGYTSSSSDTLTELYYSPDFGGMCTLPVDDPSIYGF